MRRLLVAVVVERSFGCAAMLRLAASVQPHASSDALSPLPRACVHDVWARLPLLDRLCAASVSRAWRASINGDERLWRSLDLRFLRSVDWGQPRCDALLNLCAAKATGGLTDVDVSGCLASDARLSDAAWQAVLAAHAGTLTCLAFHGNGNIWPGIPGISLDEVHRTFQTCSQLQHFGVDINCQLRRGSVAPLQALLEGGVVRAQRIQVGYADDWGGAPGLLRFLEVAAAHASLEDVALFLAPLAEPHTVEALANAAEAGEWASLQLLACGLRSSSLPALSRLVCLPALKSFSTVSRDASNAHAGEHLLSFCTAMRRSTLTNFDVRGSSLLLNLGCLGRLVGALVNHPTLTTLVFDHLVAPEGVDAPAVGAHFAKLISANNPVLASLQLSRSGLRDAGLAPVVAALGNNTHLRSLNISDNDCSAAFYQHVLLPGLSVNTTLGALVAGDDPQNAANPGGGAAAQTFAHVAMAAVAARQIAA